jgi:DNA-binding response OmpR family regulator
MKQLTQILIIGTNELIMATIERLINKEGIWKATIAYNSDDALNKLREFDFELVLLCAGIDNETSLAEKLQTLYPKLPIIKHYGGGSGLLFAEIYQALEAN